jgi:hypothetical protein
MTGAPLFAILFLTTAIVGCSRSPLALARRQSGLRVPSTAAVLEFKDESSGMLDQDLYTRVVLQLDSAGWDALVRQAREAAYVPVSRGVQLASKDSLNRFGITESGLREAREELAPSGEGFYRFRKDTPSSYSLTVLDRSRRRLVIVMLIL